MKAPPNRYPGYDVLDKWDTPSWDDTTRRVVSDRTHDVPPRRFFDPDEWRTLEALCDTLVPQPERPDPIPIAPFVDAVMVENRTNGTRYATLPAMREAWRRGLAAIDAEARLRHDAGFADLGPEEREALLRAVDAEDVSAPEWQGLSPQRLFRDVLGNEIVRIYYAHPAAWNEIGFGGPASPRGYVRLGENRRDAWEAGPALPLDGGEET